MADREPPARILLSWSGGKDSALALAALRQRPEYEIVALVTTISRAHDRISMHGVRRALLEQQAVALGLPVEQVLLPEQASNAEYEATMAATLGPYVAQGVGGVAFGDIFLEDLRQYREERLALLGLRGLFPLWGRDTATLAHEAIRQGIKAVISCVDTRALDGAFAGRPFDEQFLADLPAGVDPCGEHGEFHSFVYDGPHFQRPVRWSRGAQVERDGFRFCDLIPVTNPAC